MKQKVRYTVDTLGVYDFDGCLEDIISMLERFKLHYDGIVLSVDCDHRNNTYEIHVTTERDETDEEYRKRLAETDEKVRKLQELKEKKILKKLEDEAREYETYLKLKQKYE